MKFDTRKPTQAVVVARRYTQGISQPKLQQYELTVVPFSRGAPRCYYNAIKVAGYNPVECRYGSWGVRGDENWVTGYVFPISPKRTPAQAIKMIKKTHAGFGVKFIVNPEVKAVVAPAARKPSQPKVMPPIGTRRYACRATPQLSGGFWHSNVQIYTVVRFKRSKRIGWRKGSLMPIFGGPFPTRGIALDAARTAVRMWTGLDAAVASK